MTDLGVSAQVQPATVAAATLLLSSSNSTNTLPAALACRLYTGILARVAERSY
jgi:hypothetical protein